MTAKAPYNFIPLSDKVYSPDWADHVAHDLPFRDGESGIIEYTLTAESPLFVGGVHDRKEGDNKSQKPLDFPRDAKGVAFIPGTSVKGMTRNLLEIISFGKMRIEPSDKRAGIREFNNEELYPFKNLNVQKKIKCGWLRKKDNEIFVEECSMVRIPHHEIDAFLGKNVFVGAFKKGGKPPEQKRSEDPKSEDLDLKEAEYKYALLKKGPYPSIQVERFYKEKSIFEFCKFSKEGQWGTLVFTGQIDDYPEAGNRKKAKEKGKYHEFVFFDKSDPNEWVVKDDVFTSFLHAHQALNRENLGNWDFWKQQFDNGEKVPVFFLLDKIPNSTSIESFGLAFMYRIAFKNTPANILKQNNQVKPDLAEVIFGSTRKGLELKGRVQFGHAKWVSGQQKETYKVLLPSPRSTYYPFYVKQEVGPDGRVSKENYSHFDSAKATLAGWKRYPIANPLHSNFQGHEQDQKGTGPNEKMLTNFKPYEKGAVFKGAIYFHNLKKIEIGALLSALTFHGQQDCLHQLGMGKPLGFGKTRIQTHLVGLSHSQEAYLAAFEEEMDHFLKTEPWRETHQVLELLTLASKVNVGKKEVEEQLEYMPLENFAKVKNAKEGLLPFSRIPGVKKNSLAGYVAPEWKQTLEAERAARLDGFNQLAEQTTKQTTEQQQAQVEKEAKQKAKEDQKKQLLAAEEKKREAQRTAELEAIKALEKQELAAALKDNAAEEILACKDWDALRKFMENTYFKRLSVDALQPEHQPAVLQKLQALMELNNRQRKELSDTAGKHGPWKKHIEKWVGEATATEWKKQMNLQ